MPTKYDGFVRRTITPLETRYPIIAMLYMVIRRTCSAGGAGCVDLLRIEPRRAGDIRSRGLGRATGYQPLKMQHP
jgi:hypothetical protein